MRVINIAFSTLLIFIVFFAPSMRTTRADTTKYDFPFTGSLTLNIATSPIISDSKLLTTVSLPTVRDGLTLSAVDFVLNSFTLDSSWNPALLGLSMSNAHLSLGAADQFGGIAGLHGEPDCSFTTCGLGDTDHQSLGSNVPVRLWGTVDSPITGAPSQFDVQLSANLTGGLVSTTAAAVNGKFVATYDTPVVPNHDVVWTAAVDGNWTDGTKWSPNSPDIDSDVYFKTGSSTSYNVSFPSGPFGGAHPAKSMSIQGDTVTLSGQTNLAISGPINVTGTASGPGSLIITGGKVSAGETVAIGTTSSTFATSSMTLDLAALTGNVNNYGQLNAIKNSTISGNVVNNGVFSTRTPSYITSQESLVTINGNYVQSPSATLRLQVNRPYINDQIRISGSAQLAGTLDVTSSYVPSVGDRMTIMTYGSLKGRFDTFTGSVIKDTSGQPIAAASNEFFGLLYGAVGLDGIGSLDVVTLPVPQRVGANGMTSSLNSVPNNNTAGLILLTHGWLSNTSAWANQMAQSISHSTLVGNWDVATMDWSDFSGASLATTAAVNGNDVGESLANWMREKGITYNQMHLIGHSAGSWLINGLANGVKEHNTTVSIQETYLDAYNPSGLAFQGYASPPRLGQTANYAEQYFDGGNAILHPNFSGLDTILPTAVNFDVQKLKSTFYYLTDIPIVGPHQWPYKWYQQTILAPTGDISGGGWGFANSIEYTGRMPSYSVLHDSLVVLPTTAKFNNIRSDMQTDLLSLTHVTTGSVQSDGSGGIILSTSSLSSISAESQSALNLKSPSGDPSILTDDIVFASKTNLLSFVGQFLPSGHGLLTAYLDGDEFYQVDELDTGSDLFAAVNVYLGDEYAAGVHTLMLRLDPFDGLASTVDVNDVRFGLGTFSVPEAPTSELLTGLVAALCAARIRKAR